MFTSIPAMPCRMVDIHISDFQLKLIKWIELTLMCKNLELNWSN